MFTALVTNANGFLKLIDFLSGCYLSVHPFSILYNPVVFQRFKIVPRYHRECSSMGGGVKPRLFNDFLFLVVRYSTEVSLKGIAYLRTILP